METLTLDARQTVVVALLVLFLGKLLNSQVRFLREYNIPEPVTGGLIASMFSGLVFWVFDTQFEFALFVRDELLLIFFTTIGLSSRFATLLQGGRQLLLLLVLAAVYLTLQNGTGVAVAELLGLDPLIGVIGGSVSLSGGHGTAIAWTPIFKDTYGISFAGEVGIASATFGLIIGGVLGGPLARYLVKRYQLEPNREDAVITVGVEHEAKSVEINYQRILSALFAILVAIGIGIHLDVGLKAIGVELPTFVSCLFSGILVTNLMPLLLPKANLPKPEQSRSLALISEVSLGLFLAISLMSLELWTLIDLGFTVAAILTAQVLVILIWARWVVFKALGSNYDAAVMSAGYIGLGLGATPTAIANMTAVTQLHGPSPRAFIIVPLIGAFFIDLANAINIQLFLTLFG